MLAKKNVLLGVVAFGLLTVTASLQTKCYAWQVKQEKVKSEVSAIPGRKAAKPTESKVTVKKKPVRFYSYNEAYKLSQKSNKPLVVIVTATWCPPCQAMKNSSIPELKKNGGLKDVLVALVDVDKEKVLASQLCQGSGIPYVVVYEKKNKEWTRRSAAGYQSPLALKAFISPTKTIQTASVEKVVK